MRFSANLGLLWADRPLPDAIRAAAAAGFDAVECHWPYHVAPARVRAALAETGLPMLGINTRRGDPARGENGLAAVPGRGAEALAAVHEALSYAAAVGADAVHVMAGVAEGPDAHAAFCRTLRHACDAAPEGIMVLVEPLNRRDNPGYFLRTTEQAADIIGELGRSNLRLMFDCYHVAVTEGDVVRRLETRLPLIGHVQIASVPDRAAPDHGDLDYGVVLAKLEELGWKRPVGAEYRSAGPAGPDLGWLTRARRPRS